MRLQVRIQERFDVKGKQNLWVRSWNETIGEGIYHTHFTLSGCRWAEMLKRCNPNSKNNQRFPRYNGCSNGFRDFQEFVEWSMSEYGYAMTETIGKKETLWHLEKDIIKADNKIYSPEMCLFVPHDANALFTLSCKSRGEYPIGVSWNEKGKTLECYARTKDGRKYFGKSDDPMYLHRIWQVEKTKHIRFVADKYKEHKKLFNSLNARADIIQDDYNNHRESIFL